MRRLTVLIAALGLVFAIAAPASAAATADQKADQGWICFPAGPDHFIHCLPPSQGNGAATNALVFSLDGEEFLGTETLRFTQRDLSELPCPKEDGGTWFEIEAGVWACHHWKGAP